MSKVVSITTFGGSVCPCTATSKDNEEDIAELRAELSNIGIVVRDEKKRQYWRQI